MSPAKLKMKAKLVHKQVTKWVILKIILICRNKFSSCQVIQTTVLHAINNNDNFNCNQIYFKANYTFLFIPGMWSSKYLLESTMVSSTLLDKWVILLWLYVITTLWLYFIFFGKIAHITHACISCIRSESFVKQLVE